MMGGRAVTAPSAFGVPPLHLLLLLVAASCPYQSAAEGWAGAAVVPSSAASRRRARSAVAASPSALSESRLDDAFDEGTSPSASSARLKRPADPPPTFAKRKTTPVLAQNFKVYVHDLPKAFNQDLLGCYKTHFGKHIWEDDGKERAQNSADVWLHRLLEEHPRRTKHIEEASAFFIPFYGFLSTNFSGRPGYPSCKGLGHWERSSMLAEWLRNDKAFASYPERHIVPATYWAVAHKEYPRWDNEFFSVVTGELYDLLLRSNTRIFAYEPHFSSFRSADEYKNWTTPVTTIPYVAMQGLVNVRKQDVPAKRDLLLYFRGNVRLDSSNKSCPGDIRCVSRGQLLRTTVMGANRHFLGAGGVAEREADSAVRLEDSSSEFSVDSYAAGMETATFCLVPRGDTPTSRRLFDSIVAGCIPVIVSDEISLPFEDIVDWSEFSLRVPESMLDADGKRVAETVKAVPPYKIRAMQLALSKVREDFVYGFGSPNSFKPGRVVDNILLSL